MVCSFADRRILGGSGSTAGGLLLVVMFHTCTSEFCVDLIANGQYSIDRNETEPPPPIFEHLDHSQSSRIIGSNNELLCVQIDPRGVIQLFIIFISSDQRVCYIQSSASIS